MDDETALVSDFGTFYRRHLDGVLAFCMGRTRDRELSADLAAEVFAAALLARGRYDRRRGSLESWLLGIAAHKVADAQRHGHVVRRAQRRLGMREIEWSDDDLAEVDARLAGEPAVSLLARLPAEQRDAIRARVIEEQEYGMIAARHGVSESTARQRVSRGLAALRRLWPGEEQS